MRFPKYKWTIETDFSRNGKWFTGPYIESEHNHPWMNKIVLQERVLLFFYFTSMVAYEFADSEDEIDELSRTFGERFKAWIAFRDSTRKIVKYEE